MTQIIEEVDIYIAPDDWRSVVGMGLKEDWLADKVDEYLASGGTIKQCAAGETTDLIQKVVSGFNTANTQHRDVVNERRAKQQEAADRKAISKIEKVLDHCYDKNVKEVAAMAGMSQARFIRVTKLYFKDDQRLLGIRDGRYKSQAELAELAAKVQALYDGGLTGWHRLYTAAGIGYQTMVKLHDLGLLNIPKLPNCCGR